MWTSEFFVAKTQGISKIMVCQTDKLNGVMVVWPCFGKGWWGSIFVILSRRLLWTVRNQYWRQTTVVWYI